MDIPSKKKIFLAVLGLAIIFVASFAPSTYSVFASTQNSTTEPQTQGMATNATNIVLVHDA